METINDSGICSIQIGEEDIALRFGMPANRMIGKEMLVKPDMFQGNNIDERAITILIYAGYVNDCMSNNREPLKPFSFFYNHVEECIGDEELTETLQRVANCYSASRFTDKYIDSVKKNTIEYLKKNPTGTSSNPTATENSN